MDAGAAAASLVSGAVFFGLMWAGWRVARWTRVKIGQMMRRH